MQEYIVNLWTQDREASQPWSLSTFQNHINDVSGSTAAFDRMWADMQKIIGQILKILPSPALHVKLLVLVLVLLAYMLDSKGSICILSLYVYFRMTCCKAREAFALNQCCQG